MNFPKVSVCIISYNHSRYIKECLESVVTQQTNFDFEIIIGDDCSTDNTREIINDYASRYPGIIKPVLYEEKVGGSYNFNYVHSLARGTFVSHCDGDDLMLPGKLQKQFDYLSAHEDCAVTWHTMELFTDSGKHANEIPRPGVTYPGQKVTADYVLRVGTVAYHSSIMYRRTARVTHNPDFSTLDLYFTIEYLLSGYGFILEDILGKYRVHPVNAANSLSKNAKSFIMMRKLCASHWKQFLKRAPQYRSQIFIFAVLNFFIDFKNRRSTSLDFMRLAFASFGPFSIAEMVDSFKSTKYLRLPDSIRNA